MQTPNNAQLLSNIYYLENQQLRQQIKSLRHQLDCNYIKSSTTISRLEAQLSKMNELNKQLEEENRKLKVNEKLLEREIIALKQQLKLAGIDQQNETQNEEQTFSLDDLIEEFKQFIDNSIQQQSEVESSEPPKKKQKLDDDKLTDFSIPIFKTLKQNVPDKGISTKSMKILNALLERVLQRVTTKVYDIAQEKPDLNDKSIVISAIRDVFPKTLAEQAINFAEQKLCELSKISSTSVK